MGIVSSARPCIGFVLLESPHPEPAPDRWPNSTARPKAASDDRWDANAPAVVEWIRSGGFPETAREDLLRDVVALWDGFTPDHSAWNAAAGFLSALAAMRDAPRRESQALRALADLAAQVERCAMGTAGAEEQAVTAVRRLAGLAGPETAA